MENPRFEVFQDRRGGWRWRLRARNSRIVATGHEGYTRCRDALRAALMMKDTMVFTFRDKRHMKIVDVKE